MCHIPLHIECRTNKNVKSKRDKKCESGVSRGVWNASVKYGSSVIAYGAAWERSKLNTKKTLVLLYLKNLYEENLK